ncbi:helix-turn-helix domain-containing protein [Gracilibacillus xinjiangensis]|uniref:Helix-turn-helix domain-containing protein n=1 Tax=Gracilibacillus xinjiangensis TaxID=1193282 RepID=A0ABV8WYK8_9BACI
MDHDIEISADSLPLINEIGFMRDDDGILKHPDRVMPDLHVFVFVLSGILQIVEDGNVYDLKKGSYLFLRKNVHHWGEEFYQPGSAWFYIHFYCQDKGNVHRDFSAYRQTSIIPSDVYETKIKLPKSGQTDQETYFGSKLSQLLETFESSHPLRPIKTCMETYDLFLELYTERLNDTFSSTNRIVSKMIEMFHRNRGSKLSSEQIEQETGMNYSYLSSLFKKYTGKSVTQYRNEILIEHAIQLFKNENYNVSEVSDQLGFSNPFYFSRVFKKVTGVAPTTYLEQIYRK